MKKITKKLTLVLMCWVMIMSIGSVSLACAVGNVKTLSVKSASASGIALQWTAVSGARGYRIYKYTASEKKWKALKTTTASSYTDTAVKAGGVYYYRTKAYQYVDGKAVFSEKYSNTVKAVIAPSKVTGLTAASIDGSSVTLKWNKTENATGYRLYQYTNGKWKAVKTTTSTSYTVTGLKPSASYKFAVKAYKKSGTAAFGPLSNALTVKTGIEGATNFCLSGSTKNSYTLSWKKPASATGVQIAKYDEESRSWKIIGATVKESYTVKGEKAATPSKYRIRTYIRKDGKYSYGSYSSTVVGTTLPSIPKNLRGAVNSENDIVLAWSEVPGASGYTVYSYSAQNGSWSTVGSTTKNSFTVKNLTATDTYKYAVSAYIFVSGKRINSEKCESVSVHYKSETKPDSIYSEEMEKSGVLGYLFDPKEGCFYTSADPWQRVVGYNSIFDVVSPISLIDFDTMRLRFEYKDKDWMIQLWKGQYGLVFYGAEVGVYTKPMDRELMHYDCASDSEMLRMSMTFLEKNILGEWKEKFSRPYGEYWWCTGFIPGTRYGQYDKMKLDMRITMKDYEMLSGVKDALEENGINYTVLGLDVYFVYE